MQTAEKISLPIILAGAAIFGAMLLPPPVFADGTVSHSFNSQHTSITVSDFLGGTWLNICYDIGLCDSGIDDPTTLSASDFSGKTSLYFVGLGTRCTFEYQTDFAACAGAPSNSLLFTVVLCDGGTTMYDDACPPPPAMPSIPLSGSSSNQPNMVSAIGTTIGSVWDSVWPFTTFVAGLFLAFLLIQFVLFLVFSRFYGK
jgi:hypothetical protein